MKQFIIPILRRHGSAAIRFVLANIAGLALAGGIAHAASTEWVETEGGRIRITALPPSSEGIIRAILDVDLLPGWKTYWRDPGDAGVPPSVRSEGSTNIADLRLDFPAPERIDDGYSVWAGYNYPVVFPLTITQERAGTQSVLEAQVFLGLCETICIPLQSEFSLTIDPEHEANSFEKRLVEKAFSRIPEPAGNGFGVADMAVAEQDNTLSVSVVHPETATGLDLFLTGPAGWYFDIPVRTGGDGGMSVFRVPILDAPAGKSLSGKPLQVLVKTASRSMETTFDVP